MTYIINPFQNFIEMNLNRLYIKFKIFFRKLLKRDVLTPFTS